MSSLQSALCAAGGQFPGQGAERSFWRKRSLERRLTFLWKKCTPPCSSLCQGGFLPLYITAAVWRTITSLTSQAGCSNFGHANRRQQLSSKWREKRENSFLTWERRKGSWIRSDGTRDTDRFKNISPSAAFSSLFPLVTLEAPHPCALTLSDSAFPPAFLPSNALGRWSILVRKINVKKWCTNIYYKIRPDSDKGHVPPLRPTL